MTLASSILAATIAAAVSPDVEAAKADRASYPRDRWPYLAYATAGHLEGEARADLIAATRLMVASSSLSPVLEHGSAVPLTGRPWLLRLDLAGLRWDYNQWRAVVERNPYGSPFPLVVRADWLLVELADLTASDAYYRLTFGKVPKTRDEFLERLGVSGAPRHRFGLVEGSSGVALQGTRWIESRPVLRGYGWGTRDVAKVTSETDPLESPLGDFKHDAEEWIIGIPKMSLRTGARGALQVYALASSDGELLPRAPANIVEDSTRFRGTREIRAPGSCVQCHASGLNDPTVNALKTIIGEGVDVYADLEERLRIEAFHFSDLGRELDRNREDFAAAVEAVTGIPPIEAAAAFRRAVNRYDAPLSLPEAAGELGSSDDELRDALGLASARSSVGARVASLAHGGAVPRETWSERFTQITNYLANWRASP